MKSQLWFSSDQLRLGFVMRFKNGYKVRVEYLRSAKCENLQPVSERKVYIQNISWDAIVGFMDDSKNAEGDDVGSIFDVFVFNPRGKQIRLPGWNKRIEHLVGVNLDKVVDVLYFVKSIRSKGHEDSKG